MDASVKELVATHQKTQQGLKQKILKEIEELDAIVATHQKTQQGLKLQWLHGKASSSFCRNASENPTGIETSV